MFTDCNVDCDVYAPNVFSPNNDGRNDEFVISFSDDCRINTLELLIYDRWGNLVSKTNHTRWDGRFDNRLVASGVFSFVINYGINSFEKQKRGTVFVIK